MDETVRWATTGTQGCFLNLTTTHYNIFNNDRLTVRLTIPKTRIRDNVKLVRLKELCLEEVAISAALETGK